MLPLVIIAVLLLASCGSSASPSGASPPPARFQKAACPFKVEGGIVKPSQVRCGYLVVPENRQAQNSQTIRLAVAVFKAQAPKPAPDPLVYLEGGPGSQLVAPMGAAIAQNGIPTYVGNRDMILIDQRGAGLSRPSLACTPKETLKQCHDRLVKAGIHLAAYNTVQNAADIAALGPALGYKRVDLYGNSYGTTLALQVMRDYPQGVRAVMMDGITGPTFDVFNDYNIGTWNSLQQVYKECMASTFCNSQYPHLQTTFLQLLTRLQTHPITLTFYSSALRHNVTGKLHAVDLWSALGEGLADPNTVPLVPRLITSIAQGNYSLAIQYAESTQSQPYPDSVGMKASMNCSDGQSRSSPATIASHFKNVPAPVRKAVIASQVAALKSCNVWRASSIAPVNHTYFRSPIPTLLLSGQFDTKTPPRFARALAPKLGHAYFVLVPTLSHMVLGYGTCADLIASDFLAHPNRRPDTSCLAQLTMSWQ